MSLPLSLFISRFPKLNVTLPLLKQKIYTIASPRNRNLHNSVYISQTKQKQKCKKQKPAYLQKKKKKKNSKQTGSFENRSSEAGNPNVISVWFKYLAQWSKLLTSAKV